MNNDSNLIFEAYKNRLVNENMPSNVFHNLKKYINKGQIKVNKPSKEKDSSEFKQQMPDSKEEYSAHDYVRDMEGKGENEERRLDPKCWKGYHKSGTKLKGGVRVNNCVKN